MNSEESETFRKRRRRERDAARYRDSVEAVRIFDEHMGNELTRRRPAGRESVHRDSATTDEICQVEATERMECLSLSELQRIDEENDICAVTTKKNASCTKEPSED